jgi:hypothetical protein
MIHSYRYSRIAVDFPTARASFRSTAPKHEKVLH